MQLNERNNTKSTIAKVVLILAVVFLLFPYVYTIRFSVPSADDFGMFIGNYKGLELIEKSVFEANDRYMNWGGGWFYLFLETVLNPLQSADIYKALSLELILFFFAFCFSFSFYVYTVAYVLLRIKNKTYCLWLAFFLLAIFLCSNIYTEIFYWFVGSSYSWGMDCCFLSMAFMLRLMGKKHNPACFFLAFLFGIFACNGINNIVATGLMCLVLNIECYKGNRKNNIKYVLMLLAFVIVGVLTVFAPGNFARHDVIDSTGLHFIPAIKDALFLIAYISAKLIKRASFLFLLSILFVFSVYCEQAGFEVQNSWIRVFSFFAVSLFGAVFPIVLGYSGTYYIPNRVIYVICLYDVTGVGILTVIAGNRLGRTIKAEKTSRMQVFALPAVLLLLMLAICMKYEIRSTEPYWQTWNSFEAVKAESWDCKCLLNEIGDSKDTDVVIEHPFTTHTGILKLPEIDEDPANWVNEAVAAYYNKNSVSVKTVYNG